MFGFVGKAWNAVKGAVSKPGDSMFGKARNAQVGDSSNYDYGGSKEYAQQYRDHLQGQAGDSRYRQAPQLDRSAVNNAMTGYTNASYKQDAAFGDEAGARQQQQQALGMYRDAAMGNAPSVAAAQQQQGLEDASRMGQNLAAGAVGANPLLASNNAASASADAARRSTAGAAAMRAQEIADARQGYAGLSGQMRQGDLARGDAYAQQGQGALAAGQFGFGAEQAQGDLNMQQRQMNDQREQNFESLTAQMNRDALAGRMGYGNAQTQTNVANSGNQLQQRGQNQQFTTDLFKGIGAAVGMGG